jgi:transcriptional regulator with XRE-family HTH domain
MTIAELRKEMGLSLEGFAELLGLSSKGYAHALEQPENPATPSVKVALEIERISSGRINAADLNDDVRRVRETSAQERAA